MTMKLKKKTIKLNNTLSFKETDNKENENKLYFGKETHEAIINYQNCIDKKEKDKLYENFIRPSFHKLVENLIYIHNFTSDQNTFHILKSDCVSFLYETLEKFDKDKGSKAFSYFNVCAKNFLIIQTNKRNKNKNRHVSLDDVANLNSHDKNMIEDFNYIPPPERKIFFDEDKKSLFVLLESIKNKVKNDNEKKCIDSIITLFNRIEDLEFLNKRAIFVYLREISGLSPKQLSVSVSNIRRHYKDLVKSNDDFIGLFKEK